MRVRHKIPSIFNLSMVDVLCCALGCVILIWLINLRESKQHEEEAGRHKAEADALLAQQTDKIADLEKQRADVQARADAQAALIRDLQAQGKAAGARADSLQADLNARNQELTAARASADDLSHKLTADEANIKDLKAVAALVPGLQSDLKKAQEQYTADEASLKTLKGDLALRGQELDDATRKLLAAQKGATQTTRDLDAANKDLAALQATATKLTAELDDRKKEIAALQPFKDKFAADEDLMTTLQKELAVARTDADALRVDNTKWRNEAARIRTEADNRFAGIQLTGKRVVFLVDMSGSMDYVDDNTKAPDKWLGVRTTVAKIMRSLPELEKFQLITFSDKTHFPLGEGKWVDYDAKTSPDLVLKTLEAITPDGGTNMSDAIRAVFAMRPQGLDTVYFLSDGLPNVGEGVRPEELATLNEVERGFKLGQYIRNKLKTEWNPAVEGKVRIHLHTIGFFYESPDVGAFLWALARENDGSFVGMSKP